MLYVIVILCHYSIKKGRGEEFRTNLFSFNLREKLQRNELSSNYFHFLLQFNTTQMKNKRKRQQFNLNQGIDFNFINAAFLDLCVV